MSCGLAGLLELRFANPSLNLASEEERSLLLSLVLLGLVASFRRSIFPAFGGMISEHLRVETFCLILQMVRSGSLNNFAQSLRKSGCRLASLFFVLTGWFCFFEVVF
jgi:threonine/homoserine efflux transporter RhtA